MQYSIRAGNKPVAIRFVLLLCLVAALTLGASHSVAAQTTTTVCATSCDYTSIQAAIDAANPGDTINVKPGSYDETAAGRMLYNNTGPYQFGLFIGQDKTGLTIQGVDASGAAITDNTLLAAEVSTNATNNFGTDGVYVEADHVTIAGLTILPNLSGDNKTFEIIGDAFTLKDSHIDIPFGGSIYFNDMRFQDNTSHIQTYTLENNWLDHGASIDITSGAGFSGATIGRVTTGNRFTSEAADGANWALISFRGSGGRAWFVNPVGGAIITDNTFSGSTQYIRATGVYNDDQLDWSSFWNENSFDRAVMMGTDLPANPRAFSYDTFTNARRIGATIQGEINNALADDTVLVKAGTYSEQIVIAKSLKLLGLDSVQTIIHAPASLPAASQPESAIIRVKGLDVQAEISGLTVAGPGPTGCGSIRAGIFVSDDANANIHDNLILNIRDSGANLSGCQNGVGILVGRNAFSTNGSATITANRIEGYQKGGIVVDNAGSSAIITGNTVTGAGATESIAQNGIQISRGASAAVTNNIVSGHLCDVAVCGPDLLADQSSAGILLYQPGQGTTITANTVSDNDMGIVSMTLPGVTDAALDQNKLASNRFAGIFIGEGHAALTANEIKGSSNYGIALVSFTGDQGNAIAVATNNLIEDAMVGIALLQENGSTNHPSLSANLNSLQATTAALDNLTAVNIDAARNWWQSQHGPSASSIPGGDGQIVNGPASLSPWLCDGTDSQPANTGFQPAAGAMCTSSPTRLVFAVQPGKSVANLPLTPQPVVRAEDQDGNLGVNYSGKAQLGFGTVPSPTNLIGTLVQPFTDGIATFTDLKINQIGSGYTLLANSLPNPSNPALSSVVSDAFDVVLPGADLGITQDSSPAIVTAGGQITLVLHVSNLGPQMAAAVSVVDDLPTGFTLVSATASGWNCVPSGSTVTCQRDSLAMGASADINLLVQAPLTAGTAANLASISSTTNDPTGLNNQASRDIQVVLIPVTGGMTIYLPMISH